MGMEDDAEGIAAKARSGRAAAERSLRDRAQTWREWNDAVRSYADEFRRVAQKRGIPPTTNARDAWHVSVPTFYVSDGVEHLSMYVRVEGSLTYTETVGWHDYRTRHLPYSTTYANAVGPEMVRQAFTYALGRLLSE